jgi:pimeloyl-ACP methyl ester carboxylesterase
MSSETRPILLLVVRSMHLRGACTRNSRSELNPVEKLMKRTIGYVVASILAAVLAAPVTLSQAAWVDRSPHKTGFVSVNGIKLHYLDWGGKGRVLLFLAGVGNSAHIFDDIAPKFRDRFKVLALTRRGHGQSDKPTTGYDLATLTEDIRGFLDQLHISRATLIGHSFAGDELTSFATLYPDRVDKLVYLDAAYDRADLNTEAFSKNPFPSPPPSKEERASISGYRQWWERNRGFWSDAVEADLRETSISPDGALKSALSREAGQGIFKNATDYRPDYTKIKAPALSLYVIPSVPLWVPQDAEAQAKAKDYLQNVNLPYLTRNVDKFKKQIKRGRVVQISNSHHYLFLKSQAEVLRELRKFLY